VVAALAHPLLRRAAASAAAGGLRREAPVILRLPDGGLAEGIVDLAFREAAAPDAAAAATAGAADRAPRWIVVDFKTDRDLSARRPEYEAQLRLYTEGIRAATGEPARGALLVV
jgi:hypothetical protein